MSAVSVHEFDWPDRFVTGTIGEPGARTFYLQARDRDNVVSVALEKQQCAALADRLDEVLDELRDAPDNPYSVPDVAPAGLTDSGELDQPVQEIFRVGVITLGWDPSSSQIVIEAAAMGEVDAETLEPLDAEPQESLLVRIPVGSARAFSDRTRQIVNAGRPVCLLCGEPKDDDNHVCDLSDGLL